MHSLDDENQRYLLHLNGLSFLLSILHCLNDQLSTTRFWSYDIKKTERVEYVWCEFKANRENKEPKTIQGLDSNLLAEKSKWKLQCLPYLVCLRQTKLNVVATPGKELDRSFYPKQAFVTLVSVTLRLVVYRLVAFCVTNANDDSVGERTSIC